MSSLFCVFKAYLPLNLVENQTTVGRLCRHVMNSGITAGHYMRTIQQQLLRKPAIPFRLLQALTTFRFTPTYPEEGSRRRGQGRPATAGPQRSFSPSRAPGYKSDLPLSCRYHIVVCAASGKSIDMSLGMQVRTAAPGRRRRRAVSGLSGLNWCFPSILQTKYPPT